jgi:hypothetical protein
VPADAVFFVGESRGDRQRRVRERDQHLHGAASVIEANPAEVG